ncbi:immunoglobulin lambda-1 light chain-like [Archocentrus centrarchus]|uniref:immunoglobulin lambda-1 light chain-like n=1 Tax=Archocentrus centrarchus TaxID=63155 RepID=UPI0011EA099A|nr:immunoglobulin lambda-1 light chain-like [Archocentrus centrarchus]
MLFLPAAALCCLCSALLTMAAEQLIQDDLTLTRRVGDKVSFSCGGTEQCADSYILWYQKKETQTFRVIGYTPKSSGSCTFSKGYGHPQEDDFSAEKKESACELKINQVKLNHSATYYCSCVKIVCFTVNKIFGSGTKLYVTDEQVVKPVVSVYPAASRAHLEGSSSLLCVASAMFPPLVQFSWKRQKKNGGLEELPPAEGEQLELREPGRSASILLIPQNSTWKYSCSVKHEGGTVEAQTQEELPAPAASCPPEREPADLPALQPADWSFQSQCRVKLLCLLSTVLIVKSLVYCCGLSLLMILRNKGASTNCTHAD